MTRKDPKPEVLRLEELAISVKAGEIKLPRFQRPFVWKRPEILKLLDSIYRGYPIGSILIWNSSQKLKSERSISGLNVDSGERTLYPTNYILDGQQRLTTVCGALFWPGGDPSSVWNICFDLDQEIFVYPREESQINLFPLNQLVGTSDFIKQCMKFEHSPNRDLYYQRAERLLRSIKDYKVAVVKIGDMTVEEVAPIFERINSTGRKLTIVDLMMAATWSDGFDLNAEISRIQESLDKLGFEGVAPSEVLRVISAASGNGINKGDIQELRKLSSENLNRAARLASESVLAAARYLQTEVGAVDAGALPYGIQLIYLAEFFARRETPSNQQLDHIKQWFWYTSVTRYFGSSSTTGQVTKDLKAIRGFALGKVERLFEPQPIEISKFLFDTFNLRNASSTAFVLLLKGLRPPRTVDGKDIEGMHFDVRSQSSYGCIFPQDSSASAFNLARVIDPFSFFVNLANVKADRKLLELHALNLAIIESWLSGDEARCIEIRAEVLGQEVARLTGCEVIYRVPEQAVPAENDIDAYLE